MNKIRPENIYAELLQSAKAQTPEISTELRLKLRGRLEKAAVGKRRSVTNFRTILAVAASVLVVVTSIIIAGYNNDGDAVQRRLVYESTVRSGKPVTIKLKYNAVDDFENVKFSVVLDNGVSFFSQDSEINSKRSHEWKGSLKKGENVIPFVISTSHTGQMKIVAKAEYNDFSHLQEIILDAKEGSISVSMFSLDPVAIR